LLDPANITIEDNLTSGFSASYVSDPNPDAASGGQFGDHVLVLPNGNIAITDSWDSFLPPSGVSRVPFTGAAYLYDGRSGGLLSAFVGSTANDRVGSGGLFSLGGDYFLISSPLWNNAEALNGQVLAQAGAFTRAGDYSYRNFYSYPVNSSNSMVGDHANDRLSSGGVKVLSKDTYVVSSPHWNNDSGAVTWQSFKPGSGSNFTGTLSTSNSLYGANPGDLVGYGTNGGDGVTVLPDGNYVVNSPNWSGGLGAVSWLAGIDGSNTPYGYQLRGIAVDSTNSLVGSTPGDRVGSGGVYPLALTTPGSTATYVVSSPNWSNGSAIRAGAVTSVYGNYSYVSGNVSPANSLVGSHNDDQVGSGGITVLNNGNYVVSSPDWNGSRGAATHMPDSLSLGSAVSDTNSLVGSNPNDRVSSGGITVLSDGNYVVSSLIGMVHVAQSLGVMALTVCSG